MSKIPNSAAKRLMFSIVTVVLNDAIGLESTAKSLLAQKYKEFEWIIVDGGSSDGVFSVVDRFSELSPVVISEKDDGIYDAMNKGIDRATGSYVVFMNAGDLFADSNVLSVVSESLSSFGAVDVLYGGTNQNIGSCVFYRPPKQAKWITNGLPAFHQSTYYKTELMKLKPYNLQYSLLADYEWLASEMMSGINFCVIDRALSSFFAGGRSYTKIWLKFKESYAVKKDVLKIRGLKAASISIVAIFKTLIVTYVISNICSQLLYGFFSKFQKSQNISGHTDMFYYRHTI